MTFLRRKATRVATLESELEHALANAAGWEAAAYRHDSELLAICEKVEQEMRKCLREIAHCERRIRDGGPCPRSEYERAKCIYESHLRFLDGLLPRPASPSPAECSGDGGEVRRGD